MSHVLKKFVLSYDIAVNQWITSHNKINMTTHYITLWQEHVHGMVLVVNFFVVLKLFFCLVVAIIYLIHDEETIILLSLAAYNIWKSFQKYE